MAILRQDLSAGTIADLAASCSVGSNHTAFEKGKDLPGVPLTAHIDLSAQVGVEAHVSCAATALPEGFRRTEDGAFKMSKLGLLYNYRRFRGLGSGESKKLLRNLTFRPDRSRSRQPTTMASKHSLWIALAHAVLAGDAEFYHFDANGEEQRGCHPKDVVTPEYLQKIVDHAASNESSSSAALSLSIKLCFEVPSTGSRSESRSESSPATYADFQKDLHPFFYPPSFGMRKRKREAGQSIGVAAVPAQPRPTMSLVDAEILDLLEGTLWQHDNPVARPSSNVAASAVNIHPFFNRFPQPTKQAVPAPVVQMHPFFDRWPRNQAKPENTMITLFIGISPGALDQLDASGL